MSVPALPDRRDIAEWAVDETHIVIIESWEPALQPMIINPSTGTGPITVSCMRVYLSEWDGAVVRKEWNIISKQAMALLGSLLNTMTWRGVRFQVTRQGAPPKTTWLIRALGKQA